MGGRGRLGSLRSALPMHTTFSFSSCVRKAGWHHCLVWGVFFFGYVFIFHEWMEQGNIGNVDMTDRTQFHGVLFPSWDGEHHGHESFISLGRYSAWLSSSFSSFLFLRCMKKKRLDMGLYIDG